MNARTFGAVFASCASVWACGASSDGSEGAAVDANYVRAPSPSSTEVHSDSPTAEMNTARSLACSTPAAAPMCFRIRAAPTNVAAVDGFLQEIAVPLRCDGGPRPDWEVSSLVDRFGSQKVFMLGELHGSNEIGIVSAVLMKALASAKRVNVVAIEMPMDYTESFQRYVDTGTDALTESLFEQQAENSFGTTLPKMARELHREGVSIRLAGVDIPTDPSLAVRAIQEIATKLSTQKAAVLATLPADLTLPPSAEDLGKVNTYFEHIASSKGKICAELSATDCDRLDAMVHALWAAFGIYDMDTDSELWFARREVVIYYNLRSQMNEGDRMYAHMGAFHTNKHEASAGSRMAHEYGKTRDQVFSVGPAIGEGSVVWYGKDVALEGEPKTLVRALSSAPAHPVFVSTTRPNALCEANPLGAELDPQVTGSGARNELYDGYIHYGKLTSEIRPRDTTFAPQSGANDATSQRGSFQAFRDRVHVLEGEALRNRELSRER